MDDRTRFRVTGYAMKASVVLWICLAIAAVTAVVRAIQCVLDGRWLEFVLMLVAAGGCYGVFELSAYVMARLMTNNTEGYRPWLWGMAPRTEHGRSVQEFDIPLTYAQAMDHFVDSSDPRAV